MGPAWASTEVDDETIGLVEPRIRRRGVAEVLAIGAATTYVLFKSPRALLALRARIPTKQTIFVGPDNDDDCETIGEAVAVAGPHVTIRVARGTYRESLVVRTGVAIVARKGHLVEIAPPSGSAITVVDGDPLIKDLVLHAAPQADIERPAPVVLVLGGAPIIRSCEVWCSEGDGIAVHGAGTSAYVESSTVLGDGGACVVTDQIRAAVRSDAGAGGTVKKCALKPSGSTWIGVHVGADAAPAVTDTVVTAASGGTGLHVAAGYGRFERCAIDANVGMVVRDGGQPTVRDSTLGSSVVSLEVSGTGGGEYERCEIVGWHGVRIRDTAEPVFASCKINTHSTIEESANPVFRDTTLTVAVGRVVVALAGARGRFERCTLGRDPDSVRSIEADPWRLDPREAVVELGPHASTHFDECTIAFGQGCGVHLDSSSEGTFTGCTIHNNFGTGMVIEAGARPVVRDSVITRNGVDGVRVEDGGVGTFENCTVTSNLRTGLSVMAGADPSVRDCRIERNGGYGVVVTSGALGRITDCRLDGNALGDWLIDRDARVQLSGNAPTSA
jgi:parallel beta-helix repeat protein